MPVKKAARRVEAKVLTTEAEKLGYILTVLDTAQGGAKMDRAQLREQDRLLAAYFAARDEYTGLRDRVLALVRAARHPRWVDIVAQMDTAQGRYEAARRRVIDYRQGQEVAP